MGALVVGVGLLAVVVLIVATVGIRRQNAGVVEERLGRYSDYNFLPVAEEAKNTGRDQDKKPSALTQRLDGALASRPMGQRWANELARADLKLTVGEYFAVHILASIGLAIVAYLILFPGQIVLALLAAVIGLFVPRFYVANRKGKRLIGFEQQLPDILGLWVNSLRSGYSTMQSMEAISKEAPDPSAKEFRRVIVEVQLGLPQDQALAHLLERMPSEDLDLVITAVNIQREVGGNLAEILEVISHTIRERIKLKGEVRVLTSQGRITGYLIGGLPIILALFLLLINPDYMGHLFHSTCGWIMLGAGLTLIAIGTAVIQRIVDIEI